MCRKRPTCAMRVCNLVNILLNANGEHMTYALGKAERSSKAETSGEWTGTAGLNGCRPPKGVPGRPSF